MKDERVYISQLLDSVAKIVRFVDTMDRAAFDHDQKTQSAVIMQLLLIGEIAKKISDKTKESIDLPWRDIAGFRDVAIHNYFDVDLDIVWNTIVEDLPKMKTALEHTQLN